MFVCAKCHEVEKDPMFLFKKCEVCGRATNCVSISNPFSSKVEMTSPKEKN